MSRVTLPQTAYVVLGLMSVRPRAGHELAGYAQGSLGNFCPVTRSHVYSELDRLCRLGLLEATEVRQERFPTNRVYEITAERVRASSRTGWRNRRSIPSGSAIRSW
jgi:DNA-binding PadR family transcriptional regulator